MHGNAKGIRRRLPERYRGRDGAALLVGDLPLRATVTGVDGTFELTRMVHEALAARRRRVFAQAGLPDEPPRGRRVRREQARLLRQVQRAWPLDALVLECPAVGEAGLEFNRDLARAQTVLLTGIARDPQHGAVDPDPTRAAAVAASLPQRSTLVSGESDPRMRQALRSAVRDAGAFLIDAAPRVDHAPPGLELVTVLDRFLRIRVGGGLTSAEKVRLLARMERRLQWSPSALPGVRWHDGTSLAPTHLRAVLDHLMRRWPARLHLVAYFGDGKHADAERFVPVLARAFSDGVVAHAYVAGPGSRPVVRALSSTHAVSVFGPRPSSLPALVRVLRSECHSGAVVAAGDAGAPWMRAALDRLRLPGLPRGAWAPIGAHASDLPAAIAPARPPRPAAPAPGIGRRSRAHVLGDPDPALLPHPPRRPQGWVAPTTSAANAGG